MKQGQCEVLCERPSESLWSTPSDHGDDVLWSAACQRYTFMQPLLIGCLNGAWTAHHSHHSHSAQQRRIFLTRVYTYTYFTPTFAGISRFLNAGKPPEKRWLTLLPVPVEELAFQGFPPPPPVSHAHHRKLQRKLSSSVTSLYCHGGILHEIKKRSCCYKLFPKCKNIKNTIYTLHRKARKFNVHHNTTQRTSSV